MYYSNKEYYRKLEELKSAHLETMAKLEKMYQSKLHLKGVQPLDNECSASEQYCGSAWKKNLYQPEFSHRSVSVNKLNSATYSSISDASDEAVMDFEVENRNSVKTLSPSIKKMWNGFNVEDYIQPEHCKVLRSSNTKKIKKKPKDWSPKITVPEPFQMTVREAEKKKQKVKSRSEIEMENNMLKKQLEEEAECQKKFRAKPVPASVYLSLFDEIMERNEEHRKFVKERSKEILLFTQKPFSFIKREEKKRELKKMQLNDLTKPIRTKMFKAKPVPKFCYDSTIGDRTKEEELYREIRMHMRAQELLHSSSLPKNMLSAGNTRKKKCCNPDDEPLFKPKINVNVPDFQELHSSFQKQLIKKKITKEATACEPFKLFTSQIASNRDKILGDMKADEDHLKETRWPYISCRHQPRTRCSSADALLLRSSGAGPAKITECVKKRQNAVRKEDRRRRKEYQQELEGMQERVNQRPLLIEQVTQSNARRAAEKHYSDALREFGLSEEFVSRKGQDARKQFYHSSDNKPNYEDRESLTEDEANCIELHESQEEYQDDYEDAGDDESQAGDDSGESLRENCSEQKESDEETDTEAQITV
ncbi:protein FAM161A isoform X2 [Latimeria chalumnae]|nr:PREDICTED: protein FAM161A isoform X2 [Latimeria chalumnae]|eukprot:XP_005989629.1 PREDICTED: protein FAM161A isoform X2 [Latimeria chalumnae]